MWDCDYAIVSYNFLKNAEKLFEWANLVVYDEVHNIKSTKAQRTNFAHKFTYENSIERCLMLTGTPIQNRVYEFYSLIALANYNPKIEESAFLKKFPTYVDFANYFSYLREFEMNRGNKRVKVQQWEGIKNEDELKNKWLKNIYIRFENMEDIPSEEMEIPVSYEDNPDLLAAFEEFSPGANESVMSKVKAQAALSKASFTAEYVQNLLDQDERVVVFSDHVESAELIAYKLGVKAITGKTLMHYRDAMAERFQNLESNVIVATIGSFSTGIDLQSANNVVFNDPNWVPGNMDQARFRIKRIGQKKRCFFHYIVGSHQDSIIYQRIKQKEEVIRAVLK